MMESFIRKIGGKKVLVIDCGNCVNNASLGNSNCFKCVINALNENPDEFILKKMVDKHFNAESTNILKNYLDFLKKFEIKEKICRKCEEKLKETIEKVYDDPISFYFDIASKKINCNCDSMRFINRIKNEIEKTEIIKLAKKFKEYGSKEIYHLIFKYETKPSFISSFIFLNVPSDAILLKSYQVKNAEIRIYKSKESIEPIYFVLPPEANLNINELETIGRALKEIEEFEKEIEPEKMRSEIEKIGREVIKKIDPKITAEKLDLLNEILVRYSIGYGILEILFGDEKLQDIYIDSPGDGRVHVYHQDYEECITNIILSKEDLDKISTRIRAFSGRPFDEAYPSIDSQIKEYNVRVCGICEPLTFSGIGFAFRKHKEKAWTLPQFIENKMLNSNCAGFLNFLLQSEVSILITGTRGSGKTSLLSSFLCEIPQNYRIIIIEDTPELPVDLLRSNGYKIQHLRVRQALSKEEYELTPVQALRTALRLGESVLVIGEVRGKEARALFEAMRIGAVGNVVLGTIHGSSIYDAYDRVVNDLGVPKTSFKATDIVISCASLREKEGIKRKRRVINISEVKKFWSEDPLKENGFMDLMKYSSTEDELKFVNLKNSYVIKRICELRGMSLRKVIQSIKLRAKIKEAYVKTAKKMNAPFLLDLTHVVNGNKLFLNMMSERASYEKIYNSICKWLRIEAKV
jgi:type IV secretory pathway ATPase VirB11/archaellum biosynthesis ATPase